MLARLTRPGEPIEGAALAVGHGENEYVVVMRLKSHDVRKLVGYGPTNRHWRDTRVRPHGIHRRQCPEPVEQVADAIDELVAKALLALVVPHGRCAEFDEHFRM